MADTNKADNSLLDPILTDVLGASGTRVVGGFITGEEYLPELYWRRGIEVYDHMRRDATIQGMLKAVKHPILAADYDIQAVSDQEFDQYVSRFVKNELFDRNVKWREFLGYVLGKCDFGFSSFEKTYENKLYNFEGQPRIGIKELGWRKQWSVQRWEMSNGQPGITQELISGPVDIPQEKLVVFVNDKEGDNYQGISLLRYCYAAWDRKRYLENYLMVAASRSLGFPIVQYQDDNDKKDHQRIEEILKNFRSHQQQYLFFAQGKYQVDWMKIDTNMKSDLLPAIQHYQQEIDRSVLAQFLDLGSGGKAGGSRALSEDHSQLFEKALEAIINEVIDTINSDLIQQLCDLNFSDLPNGYPKLTYSNIGDENLTLLGDYVSKLGAVDYLTPDPDLEDWFREKADMPKLPDDIRDNYNQRVTAQTQAQPLTQVGPGQTTNAPATTGKPLQNPGTGLKDNPTSQNNQTTNTNEKKDDANKPVPHPNSGKLKVRAAEELAAYRRELIASMLADESD